MLRRRALWQRARNWWFRHLFIRDNPYLFRDEIAAMSAFERALLPAHLLNAENARQQRMRRLWAEVATPAGPGGVADLGYESPP